jgi:hypothetical protein
MMTDFDMPADGSWETRGGWLVQALAKEFDLSLEQAAGIAGNLGFESAGLTTLQEVAPAAGGRGGYGWAQWTGPRRLAFEAWCRDRGLAVSSDEANYGFLCAELRGAYKETIDALRKCQAVAVATWSVGQTYERPGGTTATNLPGYAGRFNYARRAYFTALRTMPPAPAPAPAPAPRSFTAADPRELQQALVAMGYRLAVDGNAGPQTCGAALDAIQKQEHA